MRDFKMGNFIDDHSIIFAIICGILIFVGIWGVLLFSEYAEMGFKHFHYEYLDSSGEWKEATYCSVPYKRQASCTVGSETVLDIKSFRKVADE